MRLVIASLEGLLERGAITFPQYLEGLVKIQQEVPVKDVPSSSPAVVKSEVVEKVGSEDMSANDEKAFQDAVSDPRRWSSRSNVVRDESVSVSQSTVKGDEEKEFTSGIGVSAMPGKSQHVREDVHVVASAKGLDGDLSYLLYDGSEDHEKDGWVPPKFTLYDVAAELSRYACTTTAARPRLFDAVVQQLTRLKYRSGGEARRLRWYGRWGMFANLCVWVEREVPPDWWPEDMRAARGEAASAKCETVLEKAQVAEWMMEEKLAMMQIDAVAIDVTVDECVNREGGEVRAQIEGYSVVGIYFRRR